jgi:hypothetical protein
MTEERRDECVWKQQGRLGFESGSERTWPDTAGFWWWGKVVLWVSL